MRAAHSETVGKLLAAVKSSLLVLESSIGPDSAHGRADDWPPPGFCGAPGSLCENEHEEADLEKRVAVFQEFIPTLVRMCLDVDLHDYLIPLPPYKRNGGSTSEVVGLYHLFHSLGRPHRYPPMVCRMDHGLHQ